MWLQPVCSQQATTKHLMTTAATVASGNGNKDDISNSGNGNDENAIECNNDIEDDYEPFELTPRRSLVRWMRFTILQHVHVELLHLLEKVEAPDYLFKVIIDWGLHAQAMNYSFTPWPSSRHANLKDLQDPFNMHNLCPTISELKLESVDARVPMVVFYFKTLLVLLLLTDSSVMPPENLVLNKPVTRLDGSLDVTPWFLPFKSDGMKVDEVLSGKWFSDTVSSARDPPNCFYCPLIMYVDKTFIDPMRSNFNLEPLNFTLGIFKRSCQMQFAFWRTLGFIPEQPPANDKKPAPGWKARNYHLMLQFLLRGLLAIHESPSILDNFHLRIGNHVKVVNLRVPVAFVISDTQGADKLCGRYLVYKDNVSRLHRSCRCSPTEAANTDHACEFVKMEDMMEVIERGDKDELNKLSQHYIPYHAFRNIDFGENPYGIYGATPNDILHGIKLGVIHYVLEIFIADDLNEAARHQLDQAMVKTLPHLKQGGNRGFPRMYFPHGITTLSNTTADEMLGILFITYIICVTTQGKNAVTTCETMTVYRLKLYLQLFEKVLVFHAWMSNAKDGYWRLGDTRAKRRASKAIAALVDFICENFSRKSSQGWNISKLHELLHVTHMIEQFGSPMNFDSGPCERMHKDVAKKPGRVSQKRHATFTMQAASRLADRHIIDLAYNQLVLLPEKKEPAEEDVAADACGSSYVVGVCLGEDSYDEENLRYEVSLAGRGVLSYQNLVELLYPDLVKYVASFFLDHDVAVPANINCCSEFVDESGTIFRVHYDYRATGFWHDWVWVSYTDDDAEEGFTEVPAKTLCFLPDGIPGDSRCHAVCHPCQWVKKKISQLVTQWTLVPCSQASLGNGIPYDVVPVTSLHGHCLVVPDLVEPGVVYAVLDKTEWSEKFVS